MISNFLSGMWTTIAPALGNHLWQSTLFAIAAGLLTLSLGKNHARTRCQLWLAASLKFLFPFSMLVAVGNKLLWPRSSIGTNAGFYFTLEQFNQPFTQPAAPAVSTAAHATFFSNFSHLLPILLPAVWLSGSLAVILIWSARWQRVSAVIRQSVPQLDGREVETLRRLEQNVGIQKRIELLSSRASLEPGIFGIMRPVLIWPEGISARLSGAHVEAILAHEVCHVRRRDNLVAALHMFVQAIFWFHPLVWWLGTRLIEERERACDEEVLQSGSNRQIYAECILKICEFCVASPLSCVSGVTGADLKKRISRILTEHVSHDLTFVKKLLLSAAAALVITVPLALGLLSASQTRATSRAQESTAAPVYEVVSFKSSSMASDSSGITPARILVKPDRFTVTNFTLSALIRSAYGVRSFQIVGAPSWINSEKYDIDAKLDKSAIDKEKRLSLEERNGEYLRRLRALLADRFKLTLHRETHELPVYALLIANNGPKLQDSKPDNNPERIRRVYMNSDQLSVEAVTIASLGDMLSERLRRSVVDKTGLTGTYDITLHWIPDESQPLRDIDGRPLPDGKLPPAYPDPAFFTALKDQLGLKLESQTAPVEVLVVDHTERPEN